jgi:hypothetical protein
MNSNDEKLEHIYLLSELDELKIKLTKLHDDINLFTKIREMGFSTTNSIILFNGLIEGKTLKTCLNELLEYYDITIESPTSDELPEGKRLSSTSH